MDRRIFLTAASLAAMLFPQTIVGDDDLLQFGGMEGPFASGLAAGWVKNCYGANDVVFAEEVRDVHGGRSAQRVTCTKFVSGGVQFHSADVAVEKGNADRSRSAPACVTRSAHGSRPLTRTRP